MALRVVHGPGCFSPTLCSCMASEGYPHMEDDGQPAKEVDSFPTPRELAKERPQLYPYEQDNEPVEVPEGFRGPTFKIGDRVRVVFTTLAPRFMQELRGKTGTVSLIIFCKSDGRTILYGVDCDGGKFGRFEGFELDPL